MPAGEAFTTRQREEISRAVNSAEKEGSLAVSVYVGPLDGASPRDRAEQLHGSLPRSTGRVLVAVDPGGRRVEIVTGPELQRRLDERACTLAALSMTTAFAGGDLAGGIATGVRMLGDHARAPKTLHTDTP